MAEHTAIFRASASPEIGGGHIIRCLSLARELRDQGWNCIFASEQETLMMMPIIREFKFIKLSKNDEKDEATARPGNDRLRWAATEAGGTRDKRLFLSALLFRKLMRLLVPCCIVVEVWRSLCWWWWKL